MAQEFAKLLGISDFKVSEDLPKYREELQNLLKDWPLEDIFNCDETGLFWKMEPSKSLARDAIIGKKKNKQRVTVLLCANITASAHCSEESLKSEKLSNIILHPLPANTTAHLQPMDAGIIHSFKAQYRKLLVKFRIDQFNLMDNNNIRKDINIKHAIDWIAEAWNNIKFDNPETPSSIDSIISDSTITGDIIPFQQYNNQEIQNLISQLPYEDIINTNDYIEIDDSLEIENINITNRNIINLVQKKNQPKELNKN
ncbi:5986_t:CDS:2 [Diversispora eburnea]|uniref:5986_t:CDS:1 n=1 Tax=Diversispora eburnea TaxID=1213867 RepID=A0A9N9FXL1_9GLOM|nr:5986_t:CDS:2 [Diversispora eburnea]